jgi:DNA polymerase beta
VHSECRNRISLRVLYSRKPAQSRRESPELPGVSILLFHPQHIHVPVPPPPPSPATAAAAGVPEKTPVRTRGRQPVPFLQVNSSVTEHRTSPLLQDVVRPLQAAGLLAATLASEPRKWRGVALLPKRTSVHADIDANGPLDDAWEDVGDRMRDIRASRGKYVRLDLR